MACQLLFLLLVQLLSLIIDQSAAIVLQDVRPKQSYSLFKRDDYSALDLNDEEYFMWGGKFTPHKNFTSCELTRL